MCISLNITLIANEHRTARSLVNVSVTLQRKQNRNSKYHATTAAEFVRRVVELAHLWPLVVEVVCGAASQEVKAGLDVVVTPYCGEEGRWRGQEGDG